VVREVAGFAPYEKRIMEILKGGGNNPNKRAWRFAKKRLGTHVRAKKKVEEMRVVNTKMAEAQMKQKTTDTKKADAKKSQAKGDAKKAGAKKSDSKGAKKAPAKTTDAKAAASLTAISTFQTRHSNCITTLWPVTDDKGGVTAVYTSALDGRILYWDLAKLGVAVK